MPVSEDCHDLSPLPPEFLAAIEKLKKFGPGPILKPGTEMKRKYLDQEPCMDSRVLDMIRKQFENLGEQIDG